MITGLALIIICGTTLIVYLFYGLAGGPINRTMEKDFLLLLCGFLLGIFLYFDVPEFFPNTFSKLNAVKISTENINK